MIEYITGAITALSPASVVLETRGGVAYSIAISLPVYTQLEGKAEAKLLVHESIREDAWNLYGFISSRERELFRALIGVSGVGAATAMVILSSLPVAELESVISSGDDKRLKMVKGIGAKTAQRIIVDLKDKIQVSEDAELPVMTSKAHEAYDEALAALQMLGFQKAASQKALRKLFDADPDIKVETAIKKALTMI